MSTARFGCVVPEISPDPSSSIGLKFDVEKLELSIGTPSTTNSGCAPAVTVRWPRMRMYDDAPGSPDDCVTSTLGALAASACTTFDSFDFTMSAASTALRTLPSFSACVTVPAPVTTTSPNRNGLGASRKSCVIVPGVSVIVTLLAL